VYFNILMLLLSLPLLASNDTPEQILKTVLDNQRIDRSRQRITMQIHNQRKAIKEYQFDILIRREEKTVYSYTQFLLPEEVKGIKVVVIDFPTDEDIQLLYLPALKKVNQISSKSKNRPFMGSDFSFSDLEIAFRDTDQHRVIEETDQRWIIETNSMEHSQYSKWITTIEKNILLPKEIQYFDLKGEFIKRLTVDEHKNINGSYVPVRSTMHNVQKKSKTILIVNEINVDIPSEEIPLEMFSTQYLEKQ
jgi:hypothetical protein